MVALIYGGYYEILDSLIYPVGELQVFKGGYKLVFVTQIDQIDQFCHFLTYFTKNYCIKDTSGNIFW